MSKLTRPQIFIIGGVTALVFGLGGYFGLIDPALKQLDSERTRRDTRRTKADELSTAERKKKMPISKLRRQRLIGTSTSANTCLTSMCRIPTQHGRT